MQASIATMVLVLMVSTTTLANANRDSREPSVMKKSMNAKVILVTTMVPVSTCSMPTSVSVLPVPQVSLTCLVIQVDRLLYADKGGSQFAMGLSSAYGAASSQIVRFRRNDAS